MKTRGRDSAAALAVITPDGVISIRRPDPPNDLTDEQADEWRAVVNRLPADWFPRETWPLLAQYCRHVIAARRMAQIVSGIEQADDFDLVAYDRALKMQEREGRALSSLATRMRLSQQSTYDEKKKKPKSGKTPWDFK